MYFTQMMTDEYCPRNEVQKIETELWNLSVKGTDIGGYTKCFQELALLCATMVTPESCDLRPQRVWITRQNGTTTKGTTLDNRTRGHYKDECPKLKKQGRGNKNDDDRARGRAFVISGEEARQDPNISTYNYCANYFRRYGKLVGTNTIIRGCTLNLLNRPFNIDLMPIEIGRFDVIIGMDWLSKYHVMMVCDEKLVRLPYDDILIYSRSKEEHEEHLKLILKLLKKEELYAKFSKCEFWIPKAQCLGHVIDSQGIHVDPAKIEAIKD
ncbi:hypothetical protein Tco_1375032 [Tanacetum coccineum]